MKILAVDTATGTCSVAVCLDESLLAEINLFRRQTHSRHLMEMIDQVLAISGEKLSGIDVFAVTRGPGSFTGLRMGLSCVKGLAYALDKPVIGVSCLDVLAFQAGGWELDDGPGTICTILDARKKEIYFSRYDRRNGKLEKNGDEIVVSPEALDGRVEGRCLFVGDGALLYKGLLKRLFKDSAVFVPPPQNYIRAHSVACLSLQRFSDSGADELAGLVPRYIRKSDAELGFK
jgi:tRNA threonylcarbamoyladenosine biosynthesis protein TsaB